MEGRELSAGENKRLPEVREQTRLLDRNNVSNPHYSDYKAASNCGGVSGPVMFCRNKTFDDARHSQLVSIDGLAFGGQIPVDGWIYIYGGEDNK